MFFQTLKRLSIPSLNRVTLVGALHDVQTGFLDKSSVFQFALSCSVLDFHKAAGATVAAEGAGKLGKPIAQLPRGGGEGSEPALSLAGDGSPLWKEQYTVRCLGDEAYTEMLKGILEDGCIVRVVGRIKTVESVDAGKKQLFPCIFVEQGRWSHVSLLHSHRRQRRDWQLQNALAEMRVRKQP